jgi:hypothetical protein
LAGCLAEFSNRVNNSERIKSLLKDWNRTLSIEAEDAPGEAYVVVFRDCSVVSVSRGSDESASIVMRAPAHLLGEVFSGRTNPAMAFLEGHLQVFADDRDQVKLDAISLLLWD